MHKTIKEVDTIALIVKYKVTKDEKIIETNKARTIVKVKNTLWNSTKIIPTFL